MKEIDKHFHLADRWSSRPGRFVSSHVLGPHLVRPPPTCSMRCLELSFPSTKNTAHVAKTALHATILPLSAQSVCCISTVSKPITHQRKITQMLQKHRCADCYSQCSLLVRLSFCGRGFTKNSKQFLVTSGRPKWVYHLHWKAK